VNKAAACNNYEQVE